VWWRSLWEYEERGFHGTSEASDITLVSQTLKIASLVDAFRSRGHFVASLDPLGRTLGPLVEGNDSVEYSEPVNAKDLFELLKNYPTLNLEAVGLKGVDPDRRYFLGDHLRISRATQLFWTVNEVVALLRGSYCGTTTVEHEHVVSQPAKDWIRLMVERPQAQSLFPPPYQQRILHHLLYTDYFERFLAKKFQASKRFGIEGCESLIPGLFALIERAAETGVEAIELGMSHRLTSQQKLMLILHSQHLAISRKSSCTACNNQYS
jgi:2-oxoglutarate dehydrogenase E1 component